MAIFSTNRREIFGFLGLLASMLVCPGVHSLESIVPERDLPPRNFNPHPYVSVTARGATLSNFDHPYAAIASKRSAGGHVRNRSKTVDTDQSDSIISLGNFARYILGLSNEKKYIHNNNLPTSQSDSYSQPFQFSSSISNHVGVNTRGYRIGGYIRDDQNGDQVGYENLVSEDGNGRMRKLPTVKGSREEQSPSEKPNFGSDVHHHRSSFNGEYEALEDTNDNLSQGLYSTTDEEDQFQPSTSAPSVASDITDLRLASLTRYNAASCCSTDHQISLTDYLLLSLYGINSRGQPEYFLSSSSNYYQNPRFNDQLPPPINDLRYYPLYLS